MELTGTTATATTTDGIFCIVPAAAYPPSAPPVSYLEIDGRPRWIIREGTPLPVAVAEMDRIGTHLVRHGIWLRANDGDTKPPPSPPIRALS